MEAALQGLLLYQPICLISNGATHTGAPRRHKHERNDMVNVIREWIPAKTS